MSKVFIIGAAGKVGSRLVQQLARRGHEAIALHRKPEQGTELAALGATPIEGNLLELDSGQMAQLMSGSDVVVFTAGAGGAGMDDLDWVIVRPGTLLDDTGTGKIRADVAIPYGEVSRDDVAATLAELIDQPKVSRVIIELTQGDTPISDAVRRLDRGHSLAT